MKEIRASNRLQKYGTSLKVNKKINDAGNDLVFEDDDALNWATVYQASGVGECRMYTRQKKQKTSVAAATHTSKKWAMVVGSSSRKQIHSK